MTTPREEQSNSPMGSLMEGISRTPDGLYIFPDGSTAREGEFNEAQQRQMDVFNALRLWSQTGDKSELYRLGIFSRDVS